MVVKWRGAAVVPVFQQKQDFAVHPYVSPVVIHKTVVHASAYLDGVKAPPSLRNAPPRQRKTVGRSCA